MASFEQIFHIVQVLIFDFPRFICTIMIRIILFFITFVYAEM